MWNCWSKAFWIILYRNDPWKKAFKISIVKIFFCYYKPLLPPPNLSCFLQLFIHDAKQSLCPSICDYHPLQSPSTSSTHNVIHKNPFSSINKLYHYVPLGECLQFQTSCYLITMWLYYDRFCEMHTLLPHVCARSNHVNFVQIIIQL